MKKKILLVGAFPKSKSKAIYGGQVTACSELKNSNFKNTHSLNFLDSTSRSNPPESFPIRSLYALKRIFLYLYKINFETPEVIIIFVAGFTSAIEKGLMIIIAKIFNKSVMIFPRAGSLITHYKKNFIFRKYIKFTFKKANKFLCQGKKFQSFAISELNYKKFNCPVIPNWNAKKEYLEIGYKKNYELSRKKLNIIFIGWMEKEKGIFEIIEAASILKKQNKNFNIIFGGDGNGMSKMKSLVKDKGLEKMIKFLGWIDEKEKIKLLKKSDIFILPSWNEGLPNAMIESMCAGVACIVSQVGTIADYLNHDINGLLIKPKNPEMLASSILKLIENKELLKKISKNSFIFANKNFTIENALKILNKEIDSL